MTRSVKSGAPWCTLSNLERMYDDIYDDMMTGGVAKELDDWVYQDREGNIVFSGAKQNIYLHIWNERSLWTRLDQIPVRNKMETLEEGTWLWQEVHAHRNEIHTLTATLLSLDYPPIMMRPSCVQLSSPQTADRP
jgi:hypothetical protein